MDIFILRNGQQTGPYSEETVKEYLESGTLLTSDLVWYDGLNEWKPISDISEIISVTSESNLRNPLQKSLPYTSYNQVPFYRKNWFAFLVFLLFMPGFIPILLTGNFYYVRKGQVKPYSKVAKGILIFFGFGALVKVVVEIIKLM